MKSVLKVILVFAIVFALLFGGKLVYDKFINKEKKEEELENLTWKIVNETSGMTCTQALVVIYEDDKYTYSVPNGCYSSNVFIEYSDNKRYTIREVLETNKLTPDELINSGLALYRDEKVKGTEISPIDEEELKKAKELEEEKRKAEEQEKEKQEQEKYKEVSRSITEKYSHDITINNGKINYSSKVEDEEDLNKFLKDFFERYYNIMETLEYKDISDMFSNQENAYIYKTALDLLIENRKRSTNDLSISNVKYELTIQDYKKNGNEISFMALENCSYNFNFIKQYTSSVYNIKNNFKLVKENGTYKIKSYDKVQDFYVMVSQLYSSTKDYKTSLDKIKSDYLKKFETTEQNFSKMKSDYLSGNYQVKKCDHEYNRTASYEYATKWVGRRNDSEFKSHGGANCVNFASQVMYAGGMPMDSTGNSNAQWYSKNKGKSETYSWINVDGIANYFKNNSGYGLCGKYGENVYLGEPGDLVIVGPKNDRKHATVVISQIKDSNGKVIDLLVSSNTVDLIYFPLSAYAYPYKTLLKVYGYND